MAKQLRLADSPYTIIYELLVKQLKDDPVLKRVVKPTGWITYTDIGGEAPGAVAATGTLPSIETMPLAEPAMPLSTTRQDAPLGITIILTTAGQDVRDNLNLWGAVSDAIFQGDGQAALGARIRAALAATGRSDFLSIRLAVPALTPVADPRTAQDVQTKGSLIADTTVRR